MTFSPDVIKGAATFWNVDQNESLRRLQFQENSFLETNENELGWFRQSDEGPIWVPAYMDA